MRRGRWRTAPAALLAVLLTVAGACAGDDAAAPPGGDAGSATTTSPASTTTVEPAPVTVTGPITGGRYGVPYNPMPPDLPGAEGYVEEEFFVSGDAARYTPTEPLAADGRWHVEPDGTAPYTTRILVRRPTDPDRFNGTVLVEWLNVTAGRDSDPAFGLLYPELFREGYAYVAVSAQEVSVEGGGPPIEVPNVPPEALAPLKVWDPERYGDLHHPGDDHSYDLFAQVAHLLRSGAPGDVDPLGGLRPRVLLAAGESQSAMRLVTYVNAVQPLDGWFDGFLVQGRPAVSAPLGGDPGEGAPSPSLLRTDLAPVLQIQSETDLEALGFIGARQPDDGSVVTWEVAGSAHADRSFLDYGIASGQVWAPDRELDLSSLCGEVNTGPLGPVTRAALAALRAWVVDGEPPPHAPTMDSEGGAILRDDHGNALGGLRTPPVDVPVATLTGKGSDASFLCLLFGQTVPFPPEELAARYPTHQAYVDAVERAADDAIAAGYLLRPDAEEMVAAAEAAPVPSRGQPAG